MQATELFEHLEQWRVIVCRQCRYAVWPSEVATHLTSKQHGHNRKVARSVAEEVEGWPGTIAYPGMFELPSFVTTPIPQIPLFDDGLQCQIDPVRCQYITRGIKALKEHWRTSHGWSVQQGRGGSGGAKQADAQKRFDEASKTVRCQRLFVNRAHSQYFEARTNEDRSTSTDANRHGKGIWEAAWAEASRQYDQQR